LNTINDRAIAHCCNLCWSL